MGTPAVDLDGAQPRRSIACIEECGSRYGSNGRQRVWSAGAACTRTSGGPSPLVHHAISVPSRDTTRVTVGSFVLAISALLRGPGWRC
jgi:hypothetical protein